MVVQIAAGGDQLTQQLTSRNRSAPRATCSPQRPRRSVAGRLTRRVVVTGRVGGRPSPPWHQDGSTATGVAFSTDFLEPLLSKRTRRTPCPSRRPVSSRCRASILLTVRVSGVAAIFPRSCAPASLPTSARNAGRGSRREPKAWMRPSTRAPCSAGLKTTELGLRRSASGRGLSVTSQTASSPLASRSPAPSPGGFRAVRPATGRPRWSPPRQAGRRLIRRSSVRPWVG